MATFYKYKERDDISRSMIDWSGITKQISDNLMGEKKRRDDLKQKIEEDQLQKLKAIDEYSQGLDPTMNQSMMKIAQNYKDYLLNSHKLMKRGLVSVNDTKIRKQGAMDTFNAINDATKVYNEKIGSFVEAGGSVNEFLASNMARALDISKSQLVIDDMGRGTFVTKDENGNEVVVPATSISNILNEKYDRFDTTGEVVNVVKGLADWTITSKGGYKSVSDFRQKDGKNYKNTVMSKVDSILNSDKRVVEAAADMLGMKPTYDKKLVESEPDKYILAENKGGKITFDVGGIKERVREGLYKQIDAAVSHTEKETPYRPTQTSSRERGMQKEASSLYDLSMRASQGDSAAFDQIAKTLYTVTDEKGTKKSVKLARPVLTSDGEIRITDVNGKEVLRVPSGPESALAIANIIRSGESADRVQSMFQEGERIFRGSVPSLRGDVEQSSNLVSSINNMPENEDMAKEFLQDRLSNMGVEVDVPWAPGSDVIRLTKSGESAEFSTRDIEGISAWLKERNALPMEAKKAQNTEPQDTTDSLYSN